MAADEESFLAEIHFGGGTWTNEVFPLGQVFQEVKVWAVSQAQEGHAGYEVVFIKMQKYNKKFDQFVDVKNLLDQVQNGDRVRVILELVRFVDDPLREYSTGDDDTDEATPTPIDSVSPAGPHRPPKQPSMINCSPIVRCSPKILADAGFTPNRNPTAVKYAKYFFGDNQAIDIDSVLSQTLDPTELEELLEQFTEEKYRDAKEHVENEKARKKLVRKCAYWLMANCNETDNPTVMEKSIMAYSIWRRFPFFSSAPSDKNALPYTIIYDPLGYKGYLGNAVANKRQTKLGSASGRVRKLIRKPNMDMGAVEQNGDQQTISDGDGELKEEEANAMKELSCASEAVFTEATKNMMSLQKFRRREIRDNSEMAATQIIQAYPMLIEIPSLIVKDFEFDIKDSAKVDRKKAWTKAADYIVRQALASKTAKNGISHVLHEFHVKDESQIKEMLEDEKSFLALCLLPYVLTPSSMSGKGKMKDKEHVDRVSAATALNHLIVFEKSGSAMTAAIERCKMDITLMQPVLLAFTRSGTMGSTVHQMFIIVDYRPVELKSPDVFSAIEMLFASFYTFNLHYPALLIHVYGFFEMLFGLPPTVKISTAVNYLISRITA